MFYKFIVPQISSANRIPAAYNAQPDLYFVPGYKSRNFTDYCTYNFSFCN